MDRKEEIRDRTTELRRAVRKPSMANPGVKWAANMRRSTFKIRAKRPKVMKVMGRVMSFKKGLMKVLITPMTMAAMMAVVKLSMIKPGIR